MAAITDINLLRLSDEQKTVFETILQGHNVFLSGGAGTGKSFLIQAIKNHLPSIKAARENCSVRSEDADTNSHTIHVKMHRVRVTALTGCAAILLGRGSKTLHSWAGIGKGQGSVSELVAKIRYGKAKRNWLTTDLLIIDEISMLTTELLEKLDGIAKRMRSSCQPFGGIQVVFVGDFFQLPPVIKDAQQSAEQNIFAFQSPVWNTIIRPEHEIHLKQIHRQSDPIFQKILNETRLGKLTPESCEIIKSRIGLNWQSAKIRPTLLFPRRTEVDMINETNLRALKGTRHSYKVDLTFSEKTPIGFDKKNPDFLRTLDIMDRDSSYVSELILIEGAQVMLIYNLDIERGLSNGSRGVITGFDATAGNIPIVEFSNGIRIPVGRQSWEVEDYDGIFRTQIPLRLAYACTIHKSQGASIDCALIDIGTSTFEYGQAYVALSRVRSIEGLYIHKFSPEAVRAHPLVVSRFNPNNMVLPINIILASQSKNEQ